jgi:hypothetical protein
LETKPTDDILVVVFPRSPIRGCIDLEGPRGVDSCRGVLRRPQTFLPSRSPDMPPLLLFERTPSCRPSWRLLGPHPAGRGACSPSGRVRTGADRRRCGRRACASGAGRNDSSGAIRRRLLSVAVTFSERRRHWGSVRAPSLRLRDQLRCRTGASLRPVSVKSPARADAFGWRAFLVAMLTIFRSGGIVGTKS